MQVTHNDLPQAVASLHEKIDKVMAYMSVHDEGNFESRLPDIIGVKDCAQLLGLTTSGIYAKIHRREIPFIKLQNSSRVRFSRKQINAWIMEGQRQAA